MNERIKELEKQAISIVLNGNDPDGDVDQMYIPLEFTNKFAELMVRECIEQVEVFHIRMDARPRHIVEAIKSHFGMEE